MNEKIYKKIKAEEKCRFIRQLLSRIIILAGCAFILFRFILGAAYIEGRSMEPALYSGDIIFYTKVKKEVKRNDLVLFLNKGSELVVKRVIAMQGDEVDIRGDGDIYVNGVSLNEPFIYTDTYARSNQEMYPIVVGRQEVFVLGDNRMLSYDSRSSAVGMIRQKDIKGKVLLVFRKYWA